MTGQMYNFEAFSHQQLYDMIMAGPERGGTNDPDMTMAGWRWLCDVLIEAEREINGVLRRSGAEWEGTAAEAMRSGVQPLVGWAYHAADAAVASMQAYGNHVADYTTARRTMPPPKKAPSPMDTAKATAGLPPDEALAMQQDQQRAEQAAQAAKAQAVRVMQQYAAATGDRTGTVGAFEDPPQVTQTGAGQAATYDFHTRQASSAHGVNADAPALTGTAAAGAGTLGAAAAVGGGGTMSSAGTLSATGGGGASVAPAFGSGTAGAASAGSGSAAGGASMGGAIPAGGGTSAGASHGAAAVGGGAAGGGAAGGGAATSGRTASAVGGAEQASPSAARTGAQQQPPSTPITEPGMQTMASNSAEFTATESELQRGAAGGAIAAGAGLGVLGGAAGRAGAVGRSASRSGSRSSSGGAAAEGEAGEGMGHGMMPPGGMGARGAGGEEEHRGRGYGVPAGRGEDGEEDEEHRPSQYLVESEDIFGDGRYVSPPVIGDQD